MAQKALTPEEIKQTQAVIIKEYMECCSISKAIKRARTGTAHHYQWLKEDDEYREAFESARRAVLQVLEDEAIRRGRGWRESNTKEKGSVYRYSDACLIFMIKYLSGYQEKSTVVGNGEPIKFVVEWTKDKPKTNGGMK